MNKTISTKIIVLKKTPYQESSLIISTISADYGKIDFVVKGARKITKKEQPIVDIFRELAVEYRESSGSLHTPISLELIGEHDKIALYPGILSEILHLTSFLLKNIHPNIPCNRVYSAFNNLLEKSVENKIKPFDCMLLKIVYLFENGLLPEKLSDSHTDEKSQRQFLKKLIDYSEGNTTSIPKLSAEYWNKLEKWIIYLCHYNDLKEDHTDFSIFT